LSDNDNATSWMDRPLVCFDLETTGPQPAAARIVTAALVWMEPLSGATDSETWLADPGVDIPAEATAVHGITTDHARAHGRPAAEVCQELHEQLQVAWEHDAPVIAFNASFDLTVLDAELRRHHGHGIGQVGPVVDPYVIDRAVDRYRRGKRKLGMVCKHYGVDLSEAAAHTSDGDALATAQLTVALAKRHPNIAGMPLHELHAWQAQAHRAWAVEFEGWLRNTKRSEGATAAEIAAIVIEREWPLRGAGVSELPKAVSHQ
jgi:DNA polymerase-3 subunit epsilon